MIVSQKICSAGACRPQSRRIWLSSKSLSIRVFTALAGATYWQVNTISTRMRGKLDNSFCSRGTDFYLR
jgi:hypothetical protein